ncbi:hypothetical protein U1Q18_015144 [Sarracenia purpurea var. burkii]
MVGALAIGDLKATWEQGSKEESNLSARPGSGLADNLESSSSCGLSRIKISESSQFLRSRNGVCVKESRKCITGFELRLRILVELFPNLEGNNYLFPSLPNYRILSLKHSKSNLRKLFLFDSQRPHSCEYWEIEDRSVRWPGRQEIPQRHHCL